MALSVVQNTKGHDSGFNSSVTTAAFGSSTTSGNTIAVVVSADSGSADISSVTDSKSNTYTKVPGSGAYSAGAVGVEIWYAQNITGGASHTVTAHDSGFVVGVVIAFELAGLPTTGNIIDVVNTGTGASGSEATGNLVTTNANDIIVAGAALSASSANTWTAGTGFTLVSDVGTSAGVNTAGETRIVSATGTYTGNMTSTITNQSWAATAVAFSDTVIATSHNYTSAQTATLSFAGGIAKQTTLPSTASTSLTGVIAKRTSYPLPGGLSFAAAAVRTISHSLSSALSFAGNWVSGHLNIKALAAAISFTGAQIKSTTYPLSGASLSFAGAVAKSSARKVSGALSLSVSGGNSSISRLTGQDNSGSGTASSLTVNYPGATTAGNLLIATAYSSTNHVISMSGWTAATGQINSFGYGGLFYKLADGTETGATVSTSGFSSSILLTIYEYTGNANPIAVDVGPLTNGSGLNGLTQPTCATMTTTQAGDLIFATAAFDGNAGTALTWTNLNKRLNISPGNAIINGDLIPGVIETGFIAKVTQSPAQDWGTIIAAFKARTGTPGLVKQTLLPVTAALGFAGSFIRSTAHGLTAALSYIGNFTGAKVSHQLSQTLTAAMSFTGSLSRQTSYPLSATLSFVGSVGKTMMLATTKFFAVLPFGKSVWYAGSHSVDVSGNSGWDFTA